MKIRKVIRVNVLNIVVWAVFFIIWAAGMSSNVYWSVTRQLLTMIFMTFGLMIQMISGVLDLSFAAEISASTCIGACLLRTGMPLAPAMAAVLVCHLGLGALKGFLVASLRVNPVIITLALQIIVSNLSGLFTGDHMVIFNRKDVYASHAFWLSLFVLAVVSSLFLCFFLKRTYYGKYLRMLGENPAAVRESGLNHTAIRMIISMAASVFYGIAAMILLFFTSSGSSSNGSHYLYPVIAAACMGGISFLNGRGKVFGAWLGTLSAVMFMHIIVILGIQSSFETILEGLIIIISILLAVKTANN